VEGVEAAQQVYRYQRAITARLHDSILARLKVLLIWVLFLRKRKARQLLSAHSVKPMQNSIFKSTKH
jgi:hypothetical protein